MGREDRPKPAEILKVNEIGQEVLGVFGLTPLAVPGKFIVVLCGQTSRNSSHIAEDEESCGYYYRCSGEPESKVLFAEHSSASE